MSALLEQRQNAWWAFKDHSEAHELKTKKKEWKSMTVRMASERKRADLYQLWFKLHMLCHSVGLPAQGIGELRVKDASPSRSEPRSDSELVF